MKIEKHNEALAEVEETIKESLEDERGLVYHQRRLMSMLSLGLANLVELYLHNFSAIDLGTNIKHDMFRATPNNILERLSNILTVKPEGLKNFREIVNLAHAIEKDRNEIVYGSPVSEKILKEKLGHYIDLRELCKNESS